MDPNQNGPIPGSTEAENETKWRVGACGRVWGAGGVNMDMAGLIRGRSGAEVQPVSSLEAQLLEVLHSSQL